MLVDAPVDEKACALASDRSNLAWRKDIEWDIDRYEPLVPAGATEPAWAPFNGNHHVKYARFDALNRVSFDVYAIESDSDWHSEFHWYVIVADSEEHVMRERVTALAGDLLDRLREFGGELERASANGFPEFYGSFDRKKAASLRSMLVTPAGDSRLLMMSGTTYLMVANYQGNAVIFRTQKTGSLTALCRHDAVPSRAETDIRIVNADFPCPAGEDGEGDQWDMHATIDLKEWGGRRTVTRQVSAGRMYANTLIYIGALNNLSPPTENVWRPLNAAVENHDSAELVPSPEGPYILINDWIPIRPDYMPLGKTYYRITGNGLTEVCRVTSETVPPPGYAVKN